MNARLGPVRGLGGIYWRGRSGSGDEPVALPYLCPVCGSARFAHDPVPPEWDELFANLDPSPGELAALWRREHLHCDRCRANLRIMALTKALLLALGWPVERDVRAFNLVTFLATHPWTRPLEINDSYVVGALLRRLPIHVAADYPEVDIQAMPYLDGSFPLVVHSDTLEHVARRPACGSAVGCSARAARWSSAPRCGWTGSPRAGTECRPFTTAIRSPPIGHWSTPTLVQTCGPWCSAPGSPTLRSCRWRARAGVAFSARKAR